MSGDVNPADLLECAVRAARAGGGHALANHARRGETVSVSRHDLKLRLDLECQEQVEKVVRTAFPSHAILGEESPGSQRHGAARGYEWIIDPIDGTVNFSHGLPFWCCSVAVRLDGETLAGAVFAPALGEIYAAAADMPATLNGAPIRVSRAASLDNAIVLTGMDRQEITGLPFCAYFTRIAGAARKARILGAAAIDLCWVACGRADGYFEAGIFVWDVAAGALIVRRAGGAASLLEALPGGRMRYVAGNPAIHDALRMLVT